MNMIKKPQNIVAMLTRLGEGLTDDEGLIRLNRGIMYLAIMDNPSSLDKPMFNKMAMPIFTRTVYARHGFDVPVLQYVDDLAKYIAGIKYTVAEDVQPALPGIDVEAEIMGALADEFTKNYQDYKAA